MPQIMLRDDEPTPPVSKHPTPTEGIQIEALEDTTSAHAYSGAPLLGSARRVFFGTNVQSPDAWLGLSSRAAGLPGTRGLVE